MGQNTEKFQSYSNAKPCGREKESTSLEVIFDKLKWLNSKEAALYLRVSVGQLRNMVYRDQLKASYLNNRLRFLRSDLDRQLRPSYLKEEF